jgi:hypothetical protein
VLEAGLHVDEGLVGLVLNRRPEEGADRGVGGTAAASPRLVDPHGLHEGDPSRGGQAVVGEKWWGL